MNNSIFWFLRFGIEETMWDNALLSMTSLWWPPSMSFCFYFLISPSSLIWFKLSERSLRRATDTLVFPEIVVFPRLTTSQNHGQRPGPNPFQALHRSTPVPTETSMSSLTLHHCPLPPPLAPSKSWLLVLYPFLRQHFEFFTPSWTATIQSWGTSSKCSV